MQQIDFIGKVVDNEGRSVFEEVSGTIYIRQSGALREWDGVLEIESGENPSMFRGKIVIDGREGDAFATKMEFGENVVPFQGSGPPPLDIV